MVLVLVAVDDHEVRAVFLKRSGLAIKKDLWIAVRVHRNYDTELASNKAFHTLPNLEALGQLVLEAVVIGVVFVLVVIIAVVDVVVVL